MKGDIMFAPLFSVWQIDAWPEGEDSWTWNDKFKLFEFRSRSLHMKREFPARLRYFLANHKGPAGTKDYFNLGIGWYYVDGDWDILEIRSKHDDRPWFACIRETPSH